MFYNVHMCLFCSYLNAFWKPYNDLPVYVEPWPRGKSQKGTSPTFKKDFYIWTCPITVLSPTKTIKIIFTKPWNLLRLLKRHMFISYLLAKGFILEMCPFGCYLKIICLLRPHNWPIRSILGPHVVYTTFVSLYKGLRIFNEGLASTPSIYPSP